MTNFDPPGWIIFNRFHGYDPALIFESPLQPCSSSLARYLFIFILKTTAKQGGLIMKKTTEMPKNGQKNETAQNTGSTDEKSGFFKRAWNRYLKRLNKVTDGKPQCCK